ncbi:MAG: hypothetical protein HZB25_10580 [Candidatus Eisenbacteria bacterium]|nr:hypothetical protein [Candidatus Eisenbacteria bacterium]
MLKLLFRSLLERPRRTALFLLGYAIGVSVVATLLSVGEAVLREARDKDLLGGGDVILLPAGIDVEALKVGGATALFYKIGGLRFITRSVLTSPRVAPHIAAVSPRIVGGQLYLEARGRITPVLAIGTVPSREREVLPGWSWPDSFADSPEDRRLLDPTPAEALADMDRFHAPPERALERRWVEWHYFEVFEPASGRFAYLSFQALGDWRSGRAMGLASVQLGDSTGRVERSAVPVPGARVRPSLASPDLDLGAARVTLEGRRYRVSFRTPKARGEVVFTPGPGQGFTTGEMRGDSGFVTGYSVPFVRGTATGEIRGRGGAWRFADARGYHDHNWGVWRNVSWNWGKFASDTLSLVYGQITEAGQRQPGFAVLFGPTGMIGLFRPESVEVVPGRVRVPTPMGTTARPDFVRLRATSGERDTLSMDIEVRSAVATPMPVDRDLSLASLAAASHAFVQLRGHYRVHAILDGKSFRAEGPGPLETYAPILRR